MRLNSPYGRIVTRGADVIVPVAGSFAITDLFDGTSDGSSGSEKGAWYAFDDASSYTDAGSTLVTAVDDAIHQVNDLSGNGNHLIQATLSARPLWQDPGAEIDNSNDFMVTAAIASDITGTELTSIAVFRFDGTNNFQRVASALNTASVDTSTSGAALFLRNGTGGDVIGYRNGVKSAKTVSNSTYYLGESEFDGTDHTMTTAGVDGTPVSSSGSFEVRFFNIGLTSGSAGNCTIKELIIIDRVLTSQEKSDVRSLLNTKHGL